MSAFFDSVLDTGKNIWGKPEAKIAIPAFVLCAAFSYASYKHELAKNGQIPLAFSEISQTKRNFSAKGRSVPPLTMYYSVVNDLPMKVFEANDLAYQLRGGDGSNQDFAKELEITVDPALKIHAQFSDYLEKLPQYSTDAKKSLEKIISANQNLPPIIQEFKDTWGEDHDDVYRTQTYTEQSCTTINKRRSCHTVLKTRQVYDHTVHKYTYHADHGIRAAKLLKGFMDAYPDLHVDEKLVPVLQTNADNEQAMWRSFKHIKGFNSSEYLGLANTWKTSSNYEILMPVIEDAHSNLKTTEPKWAVSKDTAKSITYSTHSRYDSGPEEYRIAEAALEYAVKISESVGTISNGIDAANSQLPALERKILEYIAVTLDGKPGDSDDLRGEVMDMAINVYKENFQGGLDPKPAKWGMVVLWAMLGGLLGAGVGAGLNAYSERRRDYY